jgi:4-aminobutyrate aminotransferase-like enzyme
MTSREVLDLLRRFESRNVTCIDADGSWPIVWERARGVHVWDQSGRRYLDLTAAFGVAAAGHANPRVVKVGQVQMTRLLHAMGDVHPHALKAKLAHELSRITFERWTNPRKNTLGRIRATGKAIFSNSGFEAVEAALKTAMLATGKRGVIAFEGGYHGLGYGALNATHRDFFRRPFLPQLGRFGHFVQYPRESTSSSSKRRRTGATLTRAEFQQEIEQLLRRHSIGAIIVEPVQGRGGIIVPPKWFLPLLRRLSDRNHVLLIADEIYTGFGRTGKWFACDHSGVIPDIICLGKALTGGFPLSACVGRAELMDAAWPSSTGEAIHTSTFLGHPVGCAMALAQIAEVHRLHLLERAARLGTDLLEALKCLGPVRSGLRLTPRGVGLMVGLELRRPDGSPATDETFQVVKNLLGLGFIVLPEGEHSNVIGFTPPLTISAAQLKSTIAALAKAIDTPSRAANRLKIEREWRGRGSEPSI